MTRCRVRASRTPTCCRSACASRSRAGRSGTSCRRASSSSPAAWTSTTRPARRPGRRCSERVAQAPTPLDRPATALDRLELRVERLHLTFRFTYAFHAREVRFECDRGRGFERIFPETFSFHAKRHDPAELFLQLQDLATRPALLAPEARARDSQLLASRLVLQLPRHLEAVTRRLEADNRLGRDALQRVWQDVALISQIAMR